MTAGLALVMRRVVKRIEGRAVIAGASARFSVGRMTLIRGARRSGKTTLARLLTGQTAPDGGALVFAGAPAPLVGAAWGFAGDVPVRRGLELRAASFGLDLDAYAAALADLLDEPEILQGRFGRVTGRDRTILLYGSAYLVPAAVYVVDGAPLPADPAARARLAPLRAQARARAAVIWLAGPGAAAGSFAPERVLRLVDGALRPADPKDADPEGVGAGDVGPGADAEG